MTRDNPARWRPAPGRFECRRLEALLTVHELAGAWCWHVVAPDRSDRGTARSELGAKQAAARAWWAGR